jgi:hypothetical protein
VCYVVNGVMRCQWGGVLSVWCRSGSVACAAPCLASNMHCITAPLRLCHIKKVLYLHLLCLNLCVAAAVAAALQEWASPI